MKFHQSYASVTQSYWIGSPLKWNVFSLNNNNFKKNSGIFERLIYWAVSSESWAEYLSLSEWSVSYIHDTADAVQAHIHGLVPTLFVL